MVDMLAPIITKLDIALADLRRVDCDPKYTTPNLTAPRIVLDLAGFKGEAVDIAAAIGYAESGGYVDAVGDLDVVGPDRRGVDWRPSCGWFQIRCLAQPLDYGQLDRWRYNFAIISSPIYSALAAYALSDQGTDFSPWTMYRNGQYREHLGRRYRLRTGHPRARLWNQATPIPREDWQT